MPKKLQKSLQEYLAKLKKPTPSIQFPSNSFSSSKNWILSVCKHPKTLSFAMDRNQEKAGKNNVDDNTGGEATLSDIDRFLFENFKSLYIEGDDEDHNYNEKKKGKESDEGENPSGAVLFGSPRSMDLPADLCGSHRFFVAPSMSSSIIEESRTSGTSMSEDAGTSSSTSTTTTLNDSTTTTNEDHHAKDDHHRDVTLPEDCVAVLAYSPSPYEDFRRSMQEMVEARGMRNHGKVEWSFMEELLFSYLNLNEKKSYRYIISAFVDLIVVLSQDSERDRSEPDRGGHEKKRDVGIL